MKELFLLCLLSISTTFLFGQKETYDLLTYMPPTGWKKEIKENSYYSYTITNKQTNDYCRIFIMLSTKSKGGIKEDFESEWKELIEKNYNPTEKPMINEVLESQGWKIKSGAVKFTFNNINCMALLTTASGFDRCVSIIAITNNIDYNKDIEGFLASVELKKISSATTQTETASNDKNTITGTWTIHSSDQWSYAINNGINGYVVRQYTFNDNGTYRFYIKTFQYVSNELLLTKENGTYQTNGNTISIKPQKSVIESWSKKDGVDKWGKLLKSQNKILENTTYTFFKHYFSGIQEMDLVLQSDKQTQRDGPFNGGTAFNNAWIYSPISNTHPLLEIP